MQAPLRTTRKKKLWNKKFSFEYNTKSWGEKGLTFRKTNKHISCRYSTSGYNIDSPLYSAESHIALTFRKHLINLANLKQTILKRSPNFNSILAVLTSLLSHLHRVTYSLHFHNTTTPQPLPHILFSTSLWHLHLVTDSLHFHHSTTPTILASHPLPTIPAHCHFDLQEHHHQFPQPNLQPVVSFWVYQNNATNHPSNLAISHLYEAKSIPTHCPGSC